MLRFVKLYKEKRVEFPKAIDLLMEIRKDREIEKENWDKLYEESYKKQSLGFDIKGVVRTNVKDL